MFKKIFYLIFGCFIFCFMTNNVNASCTVSENSRLKSLVSNVNIRYDHKIENNKATFNLIFSNVPDSVYMQDKNKNKYYADSNGEIVLWNYKDGNSYTFSFYGTYTCSNTEVGRLYATTPSYNRYYNLPVCDDAKEFSLCQRWVSHSLGKQEFIKKVNEYKIEKGIIKDDKVKKEISIIDFIFNYIRLYGIYAAIGIAIIIFIVKYIKYKKDTFGF